MPNAPENVGKLGKTGSERRAVNVTRLTRCESGFVGQSLGNDSVVFRIIVAPRYYSAGIKQKVRIL
jgi:hypothetical protein